MMDRWWIGSVGAIGLRQFTDQEQKIKEHRFFLGAMLPSALRLSQRNNGARFDGQTLYACIHAVL